MHMLAPATTAITQRRGQFEEQGVVAVVVSAHNSLYCTEWWVLACVGI